ncbi:MAG: anthranilate synthase component I [Gammaproteobacteria bacterium]|tara:strand:- start:3422 stop:4768 length:1347 start_codon:yes stop_codon:yes gene_type:complete
MKRKAFFKNISGEGLSPLEIYLKFLDENNSYFFESVEGGEKWAKYSIIGLPTKNKINLGNNPLDEIDAFMESHQTEKIDGLPDFSGGLVGFFSYDTIRLIENRLRVSKKPKLDYDEISLMISNEIIVYDNYEKSLFIIVNDYENNEQNALNRIEEIHEKIQSPYVEKEQPKKNNIKFVSSVTKEDYLKNVEIIKDYILEGDVMQVVYGQEFSSSFTGSPISLYKALRKLNPSPYMYFLKIDDLHIVGASPEILVRLQNNQVTVRPIAGTVKRGKTDEEDKVLSEQLKNDEKEIAEHLMLIDLGRNDVGRIAKTGSVETTDQMIIEKYSHVMHLVSNVIGDLKENQSAIDVLKATLPAGTLSGAPKVRAMEIIDELEPDRRGIYGGAIGYLSWTGNMDTAIAIRTAVIQDDIIKVRAGGGIVHDSDPESEYQESLNKAQSIFNAIEEMD